MSDSIGTNTDDDVSTTTDDILVVCIWSALSGYGLLTNVIIVIAIITSKLGALTSYWLVVSLSICDMSMLIVCIVHILPVTLLHVEYLPFGGRSEYMLALYNSFWYSGVLHLFLMAVNRYVNICYPEHYSRLFSRRRTSILMAIGYVIGTAAALPGLLPCCTILYDHRAYAARYEPPDSPYMALDLIINGFAISGMCFCYTCIIFRVRNSRLLMQKYRRLRLHRPLDHSYDVVESTRQFINAIGTNRRGHPIAATAFVSRRETRLFVQFAIVSTVFLLSLVTWQALPLLVSKWVGFIVTTLFFINNITNPTVYLCFNNTLRSNVIRLVCTCITCCTTTESQETMAMLQRDYEDEGGNFRRKHLAIGALASGAIRLIDRIDDYRVTLSYNTREVVV